MAYCPTCISTGWHERNERRADMLPRGAERTQMLAVAGTSRLCHASQRSVCSMRSWQACVGVMLHGQQGTDTANATHLILYTAVVLVHTLQETISLLEANKPSHELMLRGRWLQGQDNLVKSIELAADAVVQV